MIFSTSRLLGYYDPHNFLLLTVNFFKANYKCNYENKVHLGEIEGREPLV